MREGLATTMMRQARCRRTRPLIRLAEPGPRDRPAACRLRVTSTATFNWRGRCGLSNSRPERNSMQPSCPVSSRCRVAGMFREGQHRKSDSGGRQRHLVRSRRYVAAVLSVRRDDRCRAPGGVWALDLPGPSRRIRVEPIRIPDPIPVGEPESEPAREAPAGPAPKREPATPSGP